VVGVLMGMVVGLMFMVVVVVEVMMVGLGVVV